MIRAAIYPRKSKEKKDSDSMEAQVYNCTSYLDGKYGAGNYELTLYDADYGFTGHSMKYRKDFLRMMNDVKLHKIDLVVIMRYDRIARNMRDFCNIFHDIEESGSSLVSVSQQIDTSTPYGRNFMYQMAAMAELEWALTSERYKDMHRFKISHGLAYTGKLPRFGFKIEKIDGYKRIVHDKEEETRAIFEHLLLSKNKNGTAKWVRETYDPDFTLRMLQAMINSDLYIGRVRENDSFCEPYFTEEYMQRVRSLNCIKAAPSGLHYLYTGMIKCPICGSRLAANKNTMRGKTYIYYRCPSGTKGLHKHFAVGEQYLEETMISNIRLYLDSYTAKISSLTTSEKKKKTKSIEDLEQAMKRLDHLYEMGRLDIDEYDKKIRAIQKEIASLSDQLVERKVAATSVVFGNWKEIYDELTKENRKLFWQNIVREIDVNASGEIDGIKFV
ncbi:MAG: recombinase family protein [Prevotella sp.]|nr:recombinase family protein [Candidatus Prevotella equi]